MEDSYLCGYLKIKGLTEVNFKTRSDIVRLTGSLWLNWEQKNEATCVHVSAVYPLHYATCVRETASGVLKTEGQSNVHMDIRELRLASQKLALVSFLSLPVLFCQPGVSDSHDLLRW